MAVNTIIMNITQVLLVRELETVRRGERQLAGRGSRETTLLQTSILLPQLRNLMRRSKS